MRKLILLMPILLCSAICSGQNYADSKYYLIDSLVIENLNVADKTLIDSILAVYHKEKHDTSRLRKVEYLIEQCMNDDVWPQYNRYLYKIVLTKLKSSKHGTKNFSSYQKILAGVYNNLGYFYGNKGRTELQLDYYLKSLELRKKLNDKVGIASSLNNLGYVNKIKGNIDEALKYYSESSKIYHELNDKFGMALSYTNMGVLFENMGNVSKSIESHDRALRAYEEMKDKRGISHALYNLGGLYKNQGETIRARDYYNQALKLRKEIDFKEGVGFCYSNIALLFEENNELDSALFYFYKALEYLKNRDKIGESSALTNIANVYRMQGRVKESLPLYERSLEIQKSIGYKQGMASTCINMANAYYRLGYNDKAKKMANQSFEYSKQLGFPSNLRDASRVLSEIAKTERRFQEGWEHYEYYIKMRDSLKNDETEKSILKQQLKYDYEKIQAVKDAEHSKEVEIIAEKEAKQKIISISIFVGLILVIAFLIFVFNRLNLARKQKLLIENQKEEVEHQKKKLEMQNSELERTHHQLEEKNKEVIDSIRYAKKIQQALLKSEEHESKHLPEHFILFKPKDIVSGDFYWALEKDNHLYLAAADCTGHGVPGAFLTMLGTSFLNEINAHEMLFTPAEILNEMRTRFIKELSQTGADGESKDGMDISLIRLNLSTMELQWAGANNPLYLISESNETIKSAGEERTRISRENVTITAILPDKQPIAYYLNMRPFTNHNFQMMKGDYVCIFTDGFADQFGGPRGKKYKYSTLKEKLLDIYHLPMQQQKQILDTEFENWRSYEDSSNSKALEQVDDVCVIGMRI